ncbi:MAG: hypothetical protein PHV34_07975 [Verrucomicrobiae bacterium]|nr:hypothetical protein [Verrucomicrobiae bacterium]
MDKLLAGYGETRITPPMGVELAGYGYFLQRRAESALDELKARALWLGNGKESVLLVSADLLGFSVEFSDEMRRNLSRELGLPPEHILLACTHTHTGPASQPLRGCGEMSPDYMAALPGLIAAAARMARDKRVGSASVRVMSEAVMPVGYNRRHRDFGEIDPFLNVMIVERPSLPKIYVMNYACHAVVLGKQTAVSADWPGGVVAALEREGCQGMVFQGFCGDIDPVCHLNRWGGGTAATLAAYGEAMCRQVFQAEPYARNLDRLELRAVERRMRLPLKVLDRDQIQRELALIRERKGAGETRMGEEWSRAALAKCDEIAASPWLDNVPVQMIGLGDAKFLGLPGEIFSGYGVKLRQRHPGLFTVGYANGNTGYWPTGKAYEKTGDYACYGASRLYSLFSFDPSIEETVMRVCDELLVL